MLHILALQMPQRATRSYRWKNEFDRINLNAYDTRTTIKSAFVTLWHGLIHVATSGHDPSFDHLIGASEQSRRDGEAERWRRRWLACGGKRRVGHPCTALQVKRVQSW